MEVALIAAIRRVEDECLGKSMNEIVNIGISSVETIVANVRKHQESLDPNITTKERALANDRFNEQNKDARLRKNIFIVMIAFRTNDAWHKDTETVTWWKDHRGMWADMFSSEDIQKYTLNCIESQRNGRICMNCRAYDMELFRRKKYSEIVALHKCRMNHGVDLDSEMARKTQ